MDFFVPYEPQHHLLDREHSPMPSCASPVLPELSYGAQVEPEVPGLSKAHRRHSLLPSLSLAVSLNSLTLHHPSIGFTIEAAKAPRTEVAAASINLSLSSLEYPVLGENSTPVSLTIFAFLCSQSSGLQSFVNAILISPSKRYILSDCQF